MIDKLTILTIVSMASTTYITRVLGYLVLRNRMLSPRMMSVLENVPGCVLISVIAPAFVSNNLANLLALLITLLAAIRLSILPTVVIGILATGLLRQPKLITPTLGATCFLLFIVFKYCSISAVEKTGA